MKKTLLGTTAIAGVLALSQPVVAQPLTVTLGGGFQFNAGYVDEDLDTDRRGYTFETDTEVFVGAEGKAGGVTYGAKIELQGDQSDTEDSDEVYGYAFGSLGRIEFGDQDGAADRMTYFAPNSFGTGGIDGDYSNFYNGAAANNGRASVFGLDDLFKVIDSDDATKITYFSPRFAGFQFGVSFAPDGSGSGSQAETVVTGTDLTNGVLNSTGFENFYEVGLNYQQTYGGFDLGVSGAYVGASAKELTGADYEDLSGYAVGLNVGYMGFLLGGGYTFQGDSGLNGAVANDDDTSGWNIGLQYETGPFTVGANALFAEGEGSQTVVADNEFDVYSLGATYSAAPGWAAYVEASFFDYQSESGSASDNEGTVVIVGTIVEF